MKVYKTIYWLDDAESDNIVAGDSETDSITEKWMGKNHADYIKHEVRYEKALKELETNAFEYDLIIFDLNMDKDEFMKYRYKEIKKIFLDVGIITDRFTEEDIPKVKELTPENLPAKNKEHFIKNAGVYLYLYLALKGYPTDRMVIYTANGAEFIKDAISQSFKLNLKKKIIDKNNATKGGKWIDDFYNDKSKLYYRVRRLVFQACEHWKNWLEKADKIPFNHIYFSKKTEQQISSESFVEMLDRVKMLFPVVQPSKTEQVYYQALQMVAMLHEESADIRITENLFCYPWHSMIRNFRNWSAHNKFKETSIDGEQFALLFCVALRTFFDEKQETEFTDFYPYEEVFDFTCTYGEFGNMEKKNFSITNENLGRTLHKNWNELFNIGWTKGICGKLNPVKKELNNLIDTLLLSGGLSKLTYVIPQNSKTPLKKKYLFIPVWCTYYDKKTKDSIRITKECESDFSKLEDSISISYKWESDEDILNNICVKAETEAITPEAVFMRYCYRWLTEEEKTETKTE